jgi:2'-hydroxyisoflavone reductase
MKLLILGGTVFLSRHIAEAGLARGHQISIFNRGVSGAAPKDVELLRGDRAANDYSSLIGRTWDAVIDTSASAAGWVRGAMRALGRSTSHYLFTSSISAYREGTFGEVGKRESAETKPWPADADEMDRAMSLYGAQKARCEAILLEEMGDRAMIIRPGIIAGPGDISDRFTYWAVRIARGGQILAPPREAPVQFIDVRDLAEWIVRSAEERRSGVFNAVGPTMTMGNFLEKAIGALGCDTTPVWAAEDFLLKQGVAPWQELPLWIPASKGMDGHFQINHDKAKSTGLVFRPLEETVQSTVQWAKTRPDKYIWQKGIMPEKEARVLTAWWDSLLTRD